MPHSGIGCQTNLSNGFWKWRVGIDWILLAADYPYEDPNECLAFLESLPLSVAEKETVYNKNAGICGVTVQNYEDLKKMWLPKAAKFTCWPRKEKAVIWKMPMHCVPKSRWNPDRSATNLWTFCNRTEKNNCDVTAPPEVISEKRFRGQPAIQEKSVYGK